MELKENTRKFLDALAQICQIYGVDVLTAKDDEVKVVMDNSLTTVSFMQLKGGKYSGVEESKFMPTYYAELGDDY